MKRVEKDISVISLIIFISFLTVIIYFLFTLTVIIIK